MNASVTYAGNGTFNVTMDGKTQTLNMADLNTMLRMEQVEGMDSTIADQLAEIQQTNKKRKALNKLMSTMRQYKSEGKDDDYSTDMVDYSTQSADTEQTGNTKGSALFKLEGMDGKARSVDGWLDHFGITKTDVNQTADKSDRDEDWDANISAVKGEIDNITSDSEMQMLRFRQMVDKRGTALQEAKTTLSNDKRLKDAILQG